MPTNDPTAQIPVRIVCDNCGTHVEIYRFCDLYLMEKLVCGRCEEATGQRVHVHTQAH